MFRISHASINDILINYSVCLDVWYPLGASMTDHTPGGPDEYINENIKNLTPRYASAIAPIMVKVGLLERRDNGKVIFLKKIQKNLSFKEF